MITLLRLQELLGYDPVTGIFTWRRTRRRGSGAAGCLCKTHGYVNIGIDGRVYRAHRLAWLYVTGEWPKAHIDHINCLRHDNRWANLREATISQNKANNPGYSTKKTNLPKGVTLHGKARYRARIRCEGALYDLGCFLTPEEANAAYAKAAQRLFGEFAKAA